MASGGLGWALPAAVGVALAERRRVLCLIGDGSAMYSFQALWTARQHEVPLTVVVLNNGCYGAMLAFSRLMKTTEPPGVRLPNLAFDALAHAFDVECVSAGRSGDIYPALQQALAKVGPSLVNITIDPEGGDVY